MKYVVTRVSGFWKNGAPCKGAYKDDFIRQDVRTVDSPDKIPDGHSWHTQGFNHRVVDGYITRDFKDTEWFVDINTLEELTKFVDKNGRVIIEEHMSNPDYYELTIYDDYIE